MTKYTLVSEHKDDQYGKNQKVEIVFEAVTISEILEQVEYFLKANGFHFKGTIEIVENDELFD